MSETDPTYRRGEVVLGRLGSPLRDGSYDVIMCWDAVLRPVRECEGGGWYSYSRTHNAWTLRIWLKHKRAPGYAFPKGADECDADLEATVERYAARMAQPYRFRQPEVSQ